MKKINPPKIQVLNNSVVARGKRTMIGLPGLERGFERVVPVQPATVMTEAVVLGSI